MIVTLMDKNTAVAELELNEVTAKILDVKKIYNFEFLPMSIEIQSGEPKKEDFNEWWLNRSIPKAREGIEEAMKKLNLSSTGQLLLSCHGLSLSDQYWIRPAECEIEWKDINFFTNGFTNDVGNILFGEGVKNPVDLNSPCNTTGGHLKKKWEMIEGKPCLIKAGSGIFSQEPLNEVLGTSLHRRLGFGWYVPYELKREKEEIYCVCENFLSPNTEFISAGCIRRCGKKGSSYNSYDHFMNSCIELEIPDMIGFIDYMLVYDYIMANTGRDWNNFGAIRNAETLEWIGPAPLFHSSSSLWHDKLTEEIDPEGKVETRLFDTDEIRQLELVSDLSWIRFERLKNWEEDIREIFLSAGLTDKKRLEVIIEGVNKRINILQEMAEERRNMSFLYNVY